MLKEVFKIKYDYDLIIIGLGPAGMPAAAMAGKLGLKVLGIEKRHLGGECMNYGCIPSKAFIRISHEKKVPFKEIKKIVLDLRKEKKSLMKETNVEVSFNEAYIVNKHTVKHGSKKSTAKKIFIATGTRPFIPPIEGINKISYLTNENVFSMKKIPKSIFILGGGPIGVELSQAFNNYGSKVILAHMDEHIILKGDKEAALYLEKIMIKQGIKVYNSTIIKRVEEKKVGGKKKIKVYTSKGNFLVDEILIAAGRKVNVENLGLENARIKYDKHKIYVDKYLRTNIKNIYAIGDVNGESFFSHTAILQGSLAVMNSISPFKISHKKYVLPWSVFSKPEFSHVGMTEKEIKEKNIKNVEVVKYDYKEFGGSLAQNAEGFIKLYVKNFRVVGVTIIGEKSSELINEWTAIIQNKIPLYKVSFTQHTFPSLSYMNKMIVDKWMMKKMDEIKMKGIIKKFFKIF